MNKKLKDKFNDKDEFMNENFPSIQFKRKRTKSNIKMIGKLLSLLIIAGLSGALFSSLVIESKYRDLVNELNDKLEKNTITLEYSGLIEKVKQSLVTISDSEANLIPNKYFDSNTTGVIIESNGKILTNYSKIKNFKNIYVKLPSVGAKPVKAEIVVANENMDIALIQVNCDEELIPIKFVMKSDIVEGEKIFLISNSTSSDYIDNIIPGIITATNRSINTNNIKYKVLEINTPITAMNTGGIISNINGEIIGIASYKITNEMNQNGLYYALDFSSLEEVVSSTNEIKDILGISEGGFINSDKWNNVGGFYIAAINQERGSYKSGLRPTDIIFEMDGKKITSITQMSEILKNKLPGDTLKCKVMRSGEVKDLEIKIYN
ncbi:MULTISPECIES: S1C family serine protease [Clostridium]|jgi:serine protease Do|uniref:S1C family serine protease n=1 Tax=Clostridium TaxID=1485 RepID=UPI0011586E82|nr:MULTISPECIES: S1C family serine protease [Clostridium]MBS5308500.1 serine protease [Clostridium sp.]MDB1934292.1 S1C family serine protease [Clostridium tertium]MDB1937209.1 S1C family serine protease [Clostridium tertium]MDB1945066.1 S1C family serine protease [Clostridium tertium]MDB1953035.1 S1C family serine protease [Clostridium tertium]